MSEQLFNKKPEHLLASHEVEEELLPAGEVVKLLEPGEENHEKSKQIETAREAIEDTSSENQNNNVLERLDEMEETEDTLPDERSSIDHDLKDIVRNRELDNIQRKETYSQKTLSRIIHKPAIRIISEAASKTVSRPSGLLGGGLVALVGTSGYYFLTRRIGLKYNYTIFFILFVGGFVLGIMLELIAYIASAARRHR